METLSFKTIVATVRPPRIAVLVHTVDPHWQNTCVRIIEFFTQLWGGHYNIIVPTDGNTIEPRFWAMLQAFDPDYIYSYRLSGRDIKVNEPEKFEKMLTREMVNFEADQRSVVEKTLEDIGYADFKLSKELETEVKDRLIPFFFSKGQTVTSLRSGTAPHFPLTGTLDLLQPAGGHDPYLLEFVQRSTDKVSDLWLASAFGALSFDYQERLTKATSVLLRRTDINDNNLGSVVVEAAEWDRISRFAPFWPCKQGLSLYRSVRFPSHQEPALVIMGDTLQDFCLSHCLSRMRGNTVWFPSSLLEESGYPTQLVQLVMHLHQTVESQSVALWSFSLSTQQLGAIAARLDSAGLRGYVTVGYEPGRALKYRRFLLARQSSPKPIAGQFVVNSLVGFIETPVPTGFSHPTDHRWITDIEIRGYLPPRHPNLAPRMVGVRGDTEDVRTTQQGWSYRCPHEGTYFGGELDEVLIRPTLRILEVPEILQQLGQTHRLRFSLSEKGALAQDSIAKFGSLGDAASFLRDGRHRLVLDKFLSCDKVPQGVFDDGVYVQGRRYLDLVVFERLLGSRAVAATLIDDLLQKHVLHRGLVFQCTSCRNADWYSISKVSDVFECSRCSKPQQYRRENWKHPEEPSWYYKLDEIVYQGYSQGMLAPILTNDYFRRSSTSFQFASEQRVFEGDGTEPSMEIDVCAAVDGKLLIGEAKTGPSIADSAKDRRKVIEGYRQLAQRLGIHAVVFSTTANEWSAGALSDLEQCFSDSRIELVTLTGKELL
jgi:hypothetical protein